MIAKTQKRKKTGVYTRKHYNSGDGMLTYVWGPPMWHFLHTMSFNYPVSPTCEQKQQYYDFIISLKYILPCGKCRANLCKNFKAHPLRKSDLESRHSLSLYIYKLHEVVNKMLNKKSDLSYQDVRERYEHFRARCVQPVNEVAGENVEQKYKDKTDKDERGCTEPLYGDKAKCVLKIVPLEDKCKTLEIDNRCIKKRLKEPHINL